MDQPDEVECNSCGVRVPVDKDGYLKYHKRPMPRRQCDGGGRHIDFVIKQKETS